MLACETCETSEKGVTGGTSETGKTRGEPNLPGRAFLARLALRASKIESRETECCRWIALT